MSDQAETLRKMMIQRNALQRSGLKSGRRGMSRSVRVLSVASGKGGVGKTCFSANLSVLLARQGQRVLLIDGDFGLANLDIVLGVSGSATLEQVLAGEATLQEAVVGVEPNLWLLPASSGFSRFRTGSFEAKERLIEILSSMPWEMDVVIIDGGAGIGPSVLDLHGEGRESLLVVTPEPTSIADAYGLVKTLRTQVGVRRVGVVVNFVTDGREAQRVFGSLNEVVRQFLDVELYFMGHWEKDEKVSESVIRRKILLDLKSGAKSIPSLGLIAKRLMNIEVNQKAGIWTTLLGEVSA